MLVFAASSLLFFVDFMLSASSVLLLLASISLVLVFELLAAEFESLALLATSVVASEVAAESVLEVLAAASLVIAALLLEETEGASFLTEVPSGLASRVRLPCGSREFSSARASPGVSIVAMATRAVAITHSKEERLNASPFLWPMSYELFMVCPLRRWQPWLPFSVWHFGFCP